MRAGSVEYKKGKGKVKRTSSGQPSRRRRQGTRDGGVGLTGGSSSSSSARFVRRALGFLRKFEAYVEKARGAIVVIGSRRCVHGQGWVELDAAELWLMVGRPLRGRRWRVSAYASVFEASCWRFREDERECAARRYEVVFDNSS
jgi:hypothetical protein